MQVIEQLKKMDDERFLNIYAALEKQGYGPLDAEVAKAMKFRPHAIKKVPMGQRARRAKRIIEAGGNAELCYFHRDPNAMGDSIEVYEVPPGFYFHHDFSKKPEGYPLIKTLENQSAAYTEDEFRSCCETLFRERE